MKVVFLDFDGVLNHNARLEPDSDAASLGSIQETLWDDTQIEMEAVRRLNGLIERSNAYIVITSTWRKMFTMRELASVLSSRGFRYADRIIGMTPQLWRDENGTRLWRGDEIQRWLDAHVAVTHFVILDDDADMVHLAPHLIQTDRTTGLLDEHVEAAIRLLALPDSMD